MADLRITHVAIRFGDTTWSLPKPFRHHHIFAMVSLLWRPEMGIREDREEDEQGFLDSGGRFLTRAEAGVLARDAGQLRNGKQIAECLTSEDLW